MENAIRVLYNNVFAPVSGQALYQYNVTRSIFIAQADILFLLPLQNVRPGTSQVLNPDDIRFRRVLFMLDVRDMTIPVFILI